jgi:hypothetical protein
MIPVFLDSARKHKNLARTYKNWLPDDIHTIVAGDDTHSILFNVADNARRARLNNRGIMFFLITINCNV